MFGVDWVSILSEEFELECLFLIEVIDLLGYFVLEIIYYIK